ncbi:UDP-glucosyltransferase 2-like [Adelges cooleyi]|uniref:UDP-glucosyltransferase 2-like n=1 Tax=Adelges cooleyi TaxID=133065 RepID=UPI00217FAAC8|nr:UDP-glucosyltransferase 2-like [Adelges cooleyi]
MKTLLLPAVMQLLLSVEGASILAVETVGSRSHWQFMRSILDVLATRHQVTVITPLPSSDRENYTEIDSSPVFPVYSDQDAVLQIERFGSVVNMLPPMPKRSHERDICDAAFEFGPIRELLAAGRGHYDLIVLEPFYSPCLSYLAHRLGVPEIYVIPSPMITPMEAPVFGTGPNPAYVPNLLYGGDAALDDFAQRLANFVLSTYVKVVPWLTDARMANAEPKPYDVDDVRHKPSLLFANTRHITEPPRPFHVNMIQIGGIHLKTTELLPPDILEFIEDSQHGVIYFSFGSVVTLSTLTREMQRAFRNALSRVPQRVLWKYETEMEEKPDNVMTKKWFPQRDILLHPNVKMFISHGGISGLYEAVDAGVPMLAFPLYYDQPRNVANLVKAGMAISMDLLTVTEDTLLTAIDDLVNNETYVQNAKIASKRLKDRPMSPSEMVIYWTEYVLRHNGAFHLHSKALDLSWYQHLLLDVIACVLVAVFIVTYLFYAILHAFLHVAKSRRAKSKGIKSS